MPVPCAKWDSINCTSTCARLGGCAQANFKLACYEHGISVERELKKACELNTDVYEQQLQLYILNDLEEVIIQTRLFVSLRYVPYTRPGCRENERERLQIEKDCLNDEVSDPWSVLDMQSSAVQEQQSYGMSEVPDVVPV